MYDSSGMEREPFDGSYDRPTYRRRRFALPGHGPTCSADPEIGCECGEADRQAERRAERELWRGPPPEPPSDYDPEPF